jgi:hypothetical protein
MYLTAGSTDIRAEQLIRLHCLLGPIESPPRLGSSASREANLVDVLFSPFPVPRSRGSFSLISFLSFHPLHELVLR